MSKETSTKTTRKKARKPNVPKPKVPRKGAVSRKKKEETMRQPSMPEIKIRENIRTKQEVVKPKKPPSAFVSVVSSSLRKLRIGKGFSLSELKDVGLTFKKALKFGLSIDMRRRSKHNHNIESLRKWLGS